MSRTMINEYALPRYLRVEASNTARYIINRIHIHKKLAKPPFEIYHLRKPNVIYFKVFNCKCIILSTKESLGKFNVKSYEGKFICHSFTNKACRVFIKSTLTTEDVGSCPYCKFT